VVAIALAAVAAIGGALTRHTTTAPPPPLPPPPTNAAPTMSAPPPAPPPARWTITSLPDGASIVRIDTGERLGETPWHREQPRADGVVNVRVALPGYRARELTLDRAGDEHRQVQLRPLPRDPRPATQGDNDDVQVVH
jgi:serine/threonine-protein kinase